MTSRQIELVQTSFDVARPYLDAIAVIFYDRLFELDPSLSGLFHRDIDEQARSLAQALAVIVRSIDRPEQILGAIDALGHRHVAYGVRDEHYVTVGEALIWAFEHGLGDAFTPEVEQAWTAAYSWVSFRMRRAAAMSPPAETF